MPPELFLLRKVKKEEIALSCHASCCVKQSLWTMAVAHCDRALQLKPDHPKALYRRGQARARLQEYDVAIADLAKAVTLYNGDATVQAELDAVHGKSIAARSNLSASAGTPQPVETTPSITCAREPVNEKPHHSDPHLLHAAQGHREQGAALFVQEHYAEAATRFVQALGILSEIYNNTGDSSVKKEEIALSCHLNIASCCVKQSLWEMAVDHSNKALELKPNHPKALYRRGQARAQLHEHDAAIADLEKAVTLFNGDATVQAELGAVRARAASVTP